MPSTRSLLTLVLLLTAAGPTPARAQAFVEYPAHPATYGSHTIAATWPGGPASVSVQFAADGSVLHADGVGPSQRTARNTLTFAAPASASNPQDYDDLQLVARYGARLPLLQQMAANGACRLVYAFTPPVDTGFDLWVTDVDSGDSITVRAQAAAGDELPVDAWPVVDEGDLSHFKNTGTGYSALQAPLPVATVPAGMRVFRAADTTNYNRSFTILRAPTGVAVASIEVRFRGLQNSASRADAGTGSHIYLGLCTSPPLSGVPSMASAGADLRVASPARGAVLWSVTLTAAGAARLTLYDANGRRVRSLADEVLPAGTHSGRAPIDGLSSGVYWLRLSVGGGHACRRVVVLE